TRLARGHQELANVRELATGRATQRLVGDRTARACRNDRLVIKSHRVRLQAAVQAPRPVLAVVLLKELLRVKEHETVAFQTLGSCDRRPGRRQYSAAVSTIRRELGDRHRQGDRLLARDTWPRSDALS